MPIITGGRIIEGSGLDEPLQFAGVPANGVAGTGTFAGIAPKGALLTDTTNGILYQNQGTQANVTWVKVGTES